MSLDDLFPAMDCLAVRSELERRGLPIAPPWKDPWSVADALSDLLIERHAPSTLFDLLPGLESVSDEEFPWGRLSTRAVNTLLRDVGRTWGLLRGFTIEHLLGLKSTGYLTVKSIVATAVGAHLEAAGPGAGSPVPPASRQALALFAEVLDWAVDQMPGRSIGEIITVLSAAGDPPPQWAQLAAVTVEARPETIPPSSPGFADLMNRLPDRERDIIVRRLSTTEAPTLQELGDEFGITRERVRQLEHKSLQRLRTGLSLRSFSDLKMQLVEFADAVGVAAPIQLSGIADALETLAASTDISPASREFGLLMSLAGPYRFSDGWLIHERWDPQVAEELVQRLVAEGVFTTQDAVASFARLDVVPEVAAQMLRTHPDVRQISDDEWVRWVGSVGDKAEMVLSLVLRPTASPELTALIGEGHAVNSLRNVLSADERFVRVDRERYGLAAWGSPEYSGIANELANLIERSGGSIHIDQAIEKLGDLASESSVRVYAQAPRFFYDNSVVRLRNDEPYRVSSDVSRARGLFWIASANALVWALRVDADALRGSGRVAAVSAAGRLGMGPGDEATWVTSAGNAVRLTWTSLNVPQPHLSTVREVAIELDADVGDQILLVLRSGSSGLTVFKLIDGDAPTIGRLAEHVGLEVGELVQELASGVGSTPDGLAEFLQRRGDHLMASSIKAALAER